MNKLVLSLISILSLCWFISIDGWAGGFGNNPPAPPKPPETQRCYETTTTKDKDSKTETTTKKEVPCPTDNKDGNNKSGN